MADTLEPMPERIAPMLARSGALPAREEEYAFELKWDGVRALLYADAGAVRLQGRSFADFTPRYPELGAVGDALGGQQAVLDGEIVAFAPDGRPSFERLQGRMNLGSDAAVRSRVKHAPVTYVAFDLLWLNGHSTCGLTYEARRSLLARLELDGASWCSPREHRGDARALLEATAERGLEGVVAKKLGSTYEPGRRSECWIKVKNIQRTDAVIGGYTRGEGGRSSTLGALVVGRVEDGALVYAGKVGTGFTESTLRELMGALEPLRRADSPFTGRQPPRGTVFVEPRLVADVEFREWTRTGTLRAPSFKGLRRK